jgi:hypothetical protein
MGLMEQSLSWTTKLVANMHSGTLPPSLPLLSRTVGIRFNGHCGKQNSTKSPMRKAVGMFCTPTHGENVGTICTPLLHIVFMFTSQVARALTHYMSSLEREKTTIMIPSRT